MITTITASGHYIFALWFLSLFSSPNLSGRRLDVYHTSTHGVAVVRTYLECRSEVCSTRLAGNTGRKKSSFWHHRHSNTSTCPDNMVNFGLLTAEICWRIWGTTANFNGFRVLAALLHGTLVVGVSQTLRHWTEGATYIRYISAGRPSHWALAHISSSCFWIYIYVSLCSMSENGQGFIHQIHRSHQWVHWWHK